MQAANEAGKVGGRATRAHAMTGALQTRVLSTQYSVLLLRPPRPATSRSQEAGKISKSKGAGPFRELLKNHSPETIRLLLISTHYRSPILFSDEEIERHASRLETFYRFFKRFERVTGESFYSLPAPATRAEGEADVGQSAGRSATASRRSSIARNALAPRAIPGTDGRRFQFRRRAPSACLFEAVTALNRYVEQEKLETDAKAKPQQAQSLRRGAAILRELAGTLGLFRAAPATPSAGGADNELVGGLMKLLIDLRAEARKSKNFALADRIRGGLTELGVALEDRAGGTDWTRTTSS